MSAARTLLTALGGLYALGLGWGLGASTRDGRDKWRATVAEPGDGTTPVCRDCRWMYAERRGLFGQNRDLTWARCLHPTSVRSTGDVLVAGTYSPGNAHSCSVIRGYCGPGSCGPAGEHWEAAP